MIFVIKSLCVNKLIVMLLYFNNSFSDIYDKDKKMEVTIEDDTLVFKIKNKGKSTTFHLQSEDWTSLIHYVKFNLAKNEDAPSYAYRGKGRGICILNSRGEIKDTPWGEKQPELPYPDINNYSYDQLVDIFHQDGVIYALFELYEGVGDETVKKIISYCVMCQEKFVFFGEPGSARKLTLKDVSNALTVDPASVSRCTRHVRIYSPCRKVFTLDNKSLNLDQPSLFDEGIKWKDGYVSRLEVLHRIKCIREEVGDGKRLSDEEISKRLQQMGYVISRRTVTKYRNILESK